MNLENIIKLLRSKNLMFGYTVDGWDMEIELEEETDTGMINHGRLQLDRISDDVWQVSFSTLDHQFRDTGIGALMYNIGLALCSDEGFWLTNDREETSALAERVWHFWMNHPELFEQRQLDLDISNYNDENPGDYFLTDEPDDDYSMQSFNSRQRFYQDNLPPEAYNEDGLEKDYYYMYDPRYKESFLASPLTKAYKMKGSTEFLEKLEELEILYDGADW
jgi:hypothetical protein